MLFKGTISHVTNCDLFHIGYRNFFKLFITSLSWVWILLTYAYIAMLTLMNAAFPCLPPFLGSLFSNCNCNGILLYAFILMSEVIANVFIIYNVFLAGGMLISSIIIVKEYLLILTM